MILRGPHADAVLKVDLQLSKLCPPFADRSFYLGFVLETLTCDSINVVLAARRATTAFFNATTDSSLCGISVSSLPTWPAKSNF